MKILNVRFFSLVLEIFLFLLLTSSLFLAPSTHTLLLFFLFDYFYCSFLFFMQSLKYVSYFFSASSSPFLVFSIQFIQVLCNFNYCFQFLTTLLILITNVPLFLQLLTYCFYFFSFLLDLFSPFFIHTNAL